MPNKECWAQQAQVHGFGGAMQDNKRLFAQSWISCLELTVPSSVHTHVPGDPSPKCTEGLHITRENVLSNGKVMGEMLGWNG